jgi:hypothetical protein
MDRIRRKTQPNLVVFRLKQTDVEKDVEIRGLRQFLKKDFKDFKLRRGQGTSIISDIKPGSGFALAVEGEFGTSTGSFELVNLEFNGKKTTADEMAAELRFPVGSGGADFVTSPPAATDASLLEEAYEKIALAKIIRLKEKSAEGIKLWAKELDEWLEDNDDWPFFIEGNMSSDYIEEKGWGKIQDALIAIKNATGFSL